MIYINNVNNVNNLQKSAEIRFKLGNRRRELR